jgi:hypothetical protein
LEFAFQFHPAHASPFGPVLMTLGWRCWWGPSRLYAMKFQLRSVQQLHCSKTQPASENESGLKQTRNAIQNPPWRDPGGLELGQRAPCSCLSQAALPTNDIRLQCFWKMLTSTSLDVHLGCWP